MMECCHVDNMSPEHAVAGLSPGSLDPDVSIALSHLGGMWASTSSSPMTERLERCPKVHISKELKLSLLTREETEKQLTVALVACFVCVLACRINCD